MSHKGGTQNFEPGVMGAYFKRMLSFDKEIALEFMHNLNDGMTVARNL